MQFCTESQVLVQKRGINSTCRFANVHGFSASSASDSQGEQLKSLKLGQPSFLLCSKGDNLTISLSVNLFHSSGLVNKSFRTKWIGSWTNL